MRRDQDLAIVGPARLEVSLGSGSISVGVGDAGSVRVSIDAPDHADVEVSQLGDVVSIRQPSRWSMRSRSVRIAVWLPPSSDVTIDCASADVQLRGSLRAVRLKSASGDLDVDTVERIDAGTASGTVRLHACNGAATINTASGDVVVGRVGGTLAGTHASGDVQVDEAGGSVDVRTASGDVTIRRCLGDDIAVKTVSGDVTIGLPSGIRVHPDISTLSGRTTLPARGPAAADAGSRRDVRLRLRTVSGDIRVDRV